MEEKKVFRIISTRWDAIASYMDDNIRESLHNELTQWTEKDFLKAYLKADTSQDLQKILENEFNISEKDLYEFLNS